MQTQFSIRVKGTDVYKEVDTKAIPDNVMGIVLKAGLDAVLGRGRSKLAKKDSFPDAEAYAKAAVEIFEAQLEAAYSGKTKAGPGGRAAKKADDAVKKEMHRLARVDGDAILKAQGFKVTKVATEQKNLLAARLIEREPEKYRKAAEASLAAATTASEAAGFDLSFISESAKKQPRAKAAPKAPKAKPAAPPPVKAKPGVHMRQ